MFASSCTLVVDDIQCITSVNTSPRASLAAVFHVARVFNAAARRPVKVLRMGAGGN